MAGDFGYTIEHYEVSQTIGEDRLFPAVRSAGPNTTVVASGTSCRHQIADFTERRAYHMVEAIGRSIGVRFQKWVSRQQESGPVTD
ncbi:MAG: hypothetical protein R2932_48710 [Caldilineaceae bacterium]